MKKNARKKKNSKNKRKECKDSLEGNGHIMTHMCKCKNANDVNTRGTVIRYKNSPALRYKKSLFIRYISQNFGDYLLNGSHYKVQ